MSEVAKKLSAVRAAINLILENESDLHEGMNQKQFADTVNNMIQMIKEISRNAKNVISILEEIRRKSEGYLGDLQNVVD